MDFFIRIAEKYILANRKLRKLKRAVSVMMAITVFVTTYALILPAITLEKETASAQPGIEIAASDNESDSGGTVSEAGSGEEPDEGLPEDESGEQQGEAGAKTLRYASGGQTHELGFQYACIGNVRRARGLLPDHAQRAPCQEPVQIMP